MIFTCMYIKSNTNFWILSSQSITITFALEDLTYKPIFQYTSHLLVCTITHFNNVINNHLNLMYIQTLRRISAFWQLRCTYTFIGGWKDESANWYILQVTYGMIILDWRYFKTYKRTIKLIFTGKNYTRYDQKIHNVCYKKAAQKFDAKTFGLVEFRRVLWQHFRLHGFQCSPVFGLKEDD